jgi:hypothetical protein
MVSTSLDLETLGTQPPAILLWLCAITFLRNNGFIKLPAQTLSLGTLKTEQPIHCSYLLNLLALGQALDLLVLAQLNIITVTLHLQTYQPCSLQGVLPPYGVGYLILEGRFHA